MDCYTHLTVPLLLVVLSVLAWWLYNYLWVDVEYAHIPGPPAHVLWRDHRSQMDLTPWTKIRQWADEYGDFFHVRLGTTHFVYVNSREAVRELFDKQSAVTSCRGPISGEAEIVHGLRLPSMPYGPRWRIARATVHKLLTAKMAETYVPSQEFESTQLLNKLLDDDGWAASTYYAEIQRYTASGVFSPMLFKRILS